MAQREKTDQVIHVAAGVLSDDAGKILLARRLPGTHMAGKWEFPGGKLESGETIECGLRRELREELDVEVLAARPLICFEHRYPNKHVVLDVWRIDDYRGDPRAVEGHELAWVDAADLGTIDLLEADKPIVSAIRLPPQYVVSAAINNSETFLLSLDATLATGAELIQIRAPDLIAGNCESLLSDIAACCADRAHWLINGDPNAVLPLAQQYGAAGVHMPARYLDQFVERPIPADMLFAASCHDRIELEMACALDADFAVLGPVKTTTSHPDAQPLGWQEFKQLVDGLPLPVYAIGGMQTADLETAWQHGAQGVAGISNFWHTNN